MTKNLLQHGMDNLCVSEHNDLKNKDKFKKIKRLFKQQTEMNLRGAFDKWKFVNYN